MTFFDKFFTSSKNKLFRVRNETALPCIDREPSDFGAQQVRVVVFRECERRGRKLLFDSDAVERLPVDAASQADVVEVSASHAYRYKKPSKDVAAMGEMIFGTVAMTTKVRTSFKIHIIPKPPGLLFTTVVPCNSRCAGSKPGSRRVSGSSSDPSQITQGGCASDSAMVSTKSGLHRTCGYSSLRTLAAGVSEIGSLVESLRVPSCCDSRLTVAPKFFRLCTDLASRRPSDEPSSSSCSSFGDSKSSNSFGHCSGGSLTSLRRRWNQSLAVSLDGSSCDEGEEMVVKVRTKLGVCLVLNLSGPNQTDTQKFLLSNSPALDSILGRLQEDIELAYTRLDAFVQMSLMATEKAAASIVQLLCCRDNSKPKWMSPAISYRRGCCPSSNTLGQDGLPRWLRSPSCSVSPHYDFTSAFHDVLQQFDTKATNFFVSTLLTALLTHNLSWALELTRRKQFTNQVDCCYNSAARIVISDSQERPLLTTLIEVLSYFLRGCPVIEHTFSSDFIEVTCPRVFQEDRKQNQKIELKNEKKLDRVEGNSEADEGYEQETDMGKRWKTAAKLLLADKIKNPKEGKKLAREAKLSQEIEVKFGRVSLTDKRAVDCVGVEAWPSSENFDSGIDCELRELVTRSIEVDRKPEICYEMLVGSDAHLSKEKLNGLVNETKSINDFVGLKEEKVIKNERLVVEEEFCAKRKVHLKKTVSHFNFENLSDLENGPNTEGDLEGDSESRQVDWILGEKTFSHLNLNVTVEQIPFVCSEPKTEMPKVGPPVQCVLPLKTKPNFVDNLLSENKRDCCSSLQPYCSHKLSSSQQIISTNLLDTSSAKNENFYQPVMTCQARTHRRTGSCDLDSRKWANNMVKNFSAGSCSNPLSSDKENPADCNSSVHGPLNAPFIAKSGSLYPDLTDLALMENIRLQDLSSEKDKTFFVEEVLRMAERSAAVSPSLDEGYETLNGDETRDDIIKAKKDIHRTVVTKSLLIELEPEPPPRRRRKCPTRSRTVNIPVVAGLKILQQRSKTMDNVTAECLISPPSREDRLMALFHELPMPQCGKPVSSRIIPHCPFVGGVSSFVHPHQLLQGVSTQYEHAEALVQRDLSAFWRSSSTTRLTEPVSVLADMDTWSVWIHGISRPGLVSPRLMQASPCSLVADMLESFLHLHRLGVPDCQDHLEKKLAEIFALSRNVADFLLSHEFCTADVLMAHLNVQANDIPLLLAAASVHTPEIAEFYGVTIS